MDFQVLKTVIKISQSALKGGTTHPYTHNLKAQNPKAQNPKAQSKIRIV